MIAFILIGAIIVVLIFIFRPQPVKPMTVSNLVSEKKSSDTILSDTMSYSLNNILTELRNYPETGGNLIYKTINENGNKMNYYLYMTDKPILGYFEYVDCIVFDNASNYILMTSESNNITSDNFKRLINTFYEYYTGINDCEGNKEYKQNLWNAYLNKQLFLYFPDIPEGKYNLQIDNIPEGRLKITIHTNFTHSIIDNEQSLFFKANSQKESIWAEIIENVTIICSDLTISLEQRLNSIELLDNAINEHIQPISDDDLFAERFRNKLYYCIAFKTLKNIQQTPNLPNNILELITQLIDVIKEKATKDLNGLQYLKLIFDLEKQIIQYIKDENTNNF
jgi:hypothetical protein